MGRREKQKEPGSSVGDPDKGQEEAFAHSGDIAI